MSTVKINTCDKEWFGKDYVFYNKSGNPMNILYDAELDIYKGKLYFPENSSDTFKTLEVNTFERIRGFEYQQYNTGTGSTASDELLTEKFQLFNTEGIEFIGNNHTVQVDKIEAVNNREDFYSKWIYGEDINTSFPSGTEIKFNRSLFGINENESYTVIKTKRNAVMIISGGDNKTFIQNFGGIINNKNQYIDASVRGTNAIKLYNYIDKNYKNTFPDWSEPYFYNQIYSGQKINIVNSENNQGTYTIKEKTLGDNYYNNFRINTVDLTDDLNLLITNKTSNILLYSGQINIDNTNNTIILTSKLPSLLKEGTKFRIPNSIQNNDSLTVAPIELFNNVTETFYSDGNGNITQSDQVIYENVIYNCVQSYTQSASINITPLDTNFWEVSKFVITEEDLITEQINATIYLESNQVELKYTYNYNQDSITNLSTALAFHEDNLDELGLRYEIDRLGEFAVIYSKYPTDYINVDALIHKIDTFSGSSIPLNNDEPTGYTISHSPISTTNVNITLNDNIISISENNDAYTYLSETPGIPYKFNNLNTNCEIYWNGARANFGLMASDVLKLSYTTDITIKERIIERIVETNEPLTNEIHTNYSIRPEERIMFNDIDDSNISIKINGHIYEINSTIILRGNGDIDIEESIDRTLKEWINKWKAELDKRGIFVSSEYFGNNNLTNLDNSLFLRGHFPNVPLEITDIKVGDGAEFNMIDKYVVFYQLGGDSTQLNIRINNIPYIIPFVSNVETTLDNWLNTHALTLTQYGIYISREHQVLKFEKKKNIDINLDINIGKMFLRGVRTYEIFEYSIHNEGLIISSNKIIQNNNTISFEEECFSTGQILSINNSDWTLNNQEYNIIQLDPDRMVLSYQGPFWGTIDNSIQNAFFALAFGEQFNVGDNIAYIKNGIILNGIVTLVANNYYQVMTDNTLTTVERTNAFYYDPSATASLPISPDDEVRIKYLELDNNIVDIDYFNTTSDLSVVSDTIYFVDSEYIRLDKTLNIQQAIKQIVNPVNNLLYILSEDYVYIVDPYLQTIKHTIDFATNNPTLGTGYDITADSRLGDVYISFSDIDRIMYIDKDTFGWQSEDFTTYSYYGKLTYNRDDEYMYVFSRQNQNIASTAGKEVYRIDTNTKLKDTGFSISGTFSDYIGTSTTGTTISYLGLADESGTIHYNPYNGGMYISNNDKLNIIDVPNNKLIELNISTKDYYSFTLDDHNKYLWVSSADNILSAIDENGEIVTQKDISIVGTGSGTASGYGYIFMNPIDSYLYLASQDGTNKLNVYSTYLDETFYTFDLDFELDKIILNRKRESINGISFNDDKLVDIQINFLYGLKGFSTSFNNSLNSTPVGEFDNDDNVYGTLDEDYSVSDFLLLKTREFIRRPRKNYETTGAPQIQWEYSWYRELDDIFMVDISGDFLPDSGSYAYTGQKPLDNPIIKRTPNNNVNNANKSYAQQTVFDKLTYTLDYNDSDINVSFIPNGIQSFIGFNSKDETVSNNILNVYEKEDIDISFLSYDSFTSSFSTYIPEQTLTFKHNEDTGYGEIILSDDSTDFFPEIVDINNFVSSNTNLRENQNINIKLIDDHIDNYISPNNNMNVKIIKIYKRKLIVKYLDRLKFTEENTKINDRYLKTRMVVLDKKIIEFDIYGQTEIEDIRYQTELSNTGKLINPDDIFIFKEYDINEGGIDWQFMNAKRKEMLTIKNDIYNYLGAYKSIINAINFFGYNDLILNEYFQNINPESAQYLKLYKVEIEDIFDNDSSWSDNYEYYKFPNKNYEETQLFNLTYRLTDFDGNKLISYSIEEAIIKLQGLKFWLEKNIVPITHDIKDIAGEFSFKSTIQNYDMGSSINILNINDQITPVDFEINETYALPIQSGSNVYNTVIDFSVGDIDNLPDYFTLTINTYKVYDKWDPFKSYSYGEKVDYFGKIYENVLIDPSAINLGQDPTNIKNTNHNPLEYDDLYKWNINTEYEDRNLVEYDRRYYQFSYRTPTVNYPPWIGATGTCIIGTPSTTKGMIDNYYNDLIDRIGNEPNVPTYFNTEESNIGINFDILDIVKSNYPNRWCDLLNKDDILIDKIINDILNLPINQFAGDKPENKISAKSTIFQFIADYADISESYKLKYSNLNPKENLLLDNADFILWDDITKWKEVDIEPVQNIYEYRSGKDMMLPFNFTLDSKIDPFVIISCNTNNGYGQIKNIKKSYELRFDADSDSLLMKNIR